MAVLTRIPTTDIRAIDIRDTLLANGAVGVNNFLQTFFTDGTVRFSNTHGYYWPDARINKWSTWKPIRCDADTLTDSIIRNLHGGLSIVSKSLTQYARFAISLVEGDSDVRPVDWNYIIPDGSSDYPMRLGDFRGYCPGSLPVFDLSAIQDYDIRRNPYLKWPVDIGQSMQVSGGMKPSDIFANNYHFGYALIDYDRYVEDDELIISYVVANRTSIGSQGGTSISQSLSFINTGDYLWLGFIVDDTDFGTSQNTIFSGVQAPSSEWLNSIGNVMCLFDGVRAVRLYNGDEYPVTTFFHGFAPGSSTTIGDFRCSGFRSDYYDVLWNSSGYHPDDMDGRYSINHSVISSSAPANLVNWVLSFDLKDADIYTATGLHNPKTLRLVRFDDLDLVDIVIDLLVEMDETTGRAKITGIKRSDNNVEVELPSPVLLAPATNESDYPWVRIEVMNNNSSANAQNKLYVRIGVVDSIAKFRIEPGTPNQEWMIGEYDLGDYYDAQERIPNFSLGYSEGYDSRGLSIQNYSMFIKSAK